MNPKLVLTYQQQGKVIKRWTLKPRNSFYYYGSSHKSQIRLSQANWKEIEGGFEFREGQWWFIDLSNEGHESLIKDEFNITKGDTCLNINLHAPRNLFTSYENRASSGSLIMKQIIVKLNDKIIHVDILQPEKPYTLTCGHENISVPSPKSTEWEFRNYKNYSIQQRLIKLDPNTEIPLRHVDKNTFKFPMIAVSIALLFVVAIALWPIEKKAIVENNAVDLKAFQVKITTPKKDKKEKGQRQKSMAQTELKVQTNEGAAPQENKKIQRLQNIGLSQVLGKITKRASSSSKKISVIGQIAGAKNLGRALASIGNLSKGKNNVISFGSGAGVNVGTFGKAGGFSGYSGTGSLNGQGIGQNSVGLLDEESEIMGGLDREVIAQYIRTQLGQILYCYERQLSANPDLYGKVEVKFTIAGNGKVSTQKIGKTSLNNSMVESCILGKVSGWKFPEPEGGTQVFVTYPFLFKSMN